VTDVLRIALFVLVLVDPVAGAIGASDLAAGRSARERLTIALGGALVGFVALAAVAGASDPLLDALEVSAPSASLAAGIVVLATVVLLFWHGPAGRVRAAPAASAVRLALFPFGIPLLCGPAAVAGVVAWSAGEGVGTTIGALAIAVAAVAATCVAWPDPPRGRGARVLGGFTGVAMALVTADLVRDGVFGT
jgi:multiple antibiotic resistance protein